MISTASSALLPTQGAPAEWAVRPRKVKIVENRALPSTPYPVPKPLELWLSMTASTPSNNPARIM